MQFIPLLVRLTLLVMFSITTSVQAEKQESSLSNDEQDHYYLVVSGFSKHFSVDSKYDQSPLNEKNWGAGLEYQFAKSPNSRLQWLLNVGEYKDSLHTNAFYAGGAGLYEVYQYKNYFAQMGLQAAYFSSPSYNQGNPFIAVMPAMSFGTDRVATNLVIIPRVAQWMDAGVVYLQFKLRLQ